MDKCVGNKTNPLLEQLLKNRSPLNQKQLLNYGRKRFFPNLQEVSPYKLILEGFDEKIIKLTPELNTAGFQTLLTPYAVKITEELRIRNIFADSRGEFLRFGPALYLTDNQLKEAIYFLREIIQLL